MTSTGRAPIVVGVDGSDSALNAVRWAAREASLRALPLRLVHACVLPPIVHPTTKSAQEQWIETLADNGRYILDEAAAAAMIAPDIEVTTHHDVGTAADKLIAESVGAHSVVLGSRGLGGFRGMVVGSVAVALAAHGHGPVVVVRSRAESQPPPASGPIVVGVDGSPASDAAVAFAFDEASVRSTSLVAVHTWLDIAFLDSWTALPSTTDWAAVVTDEKAVLAERLAGWQEKYPDVPVTRRVLRDRPVRALMEQAEGAQLIVVGSRGRGALAGMGLGSTSQALLQTAQCPVAVVRPSASRRG